MATGSYETGKGMFGGIKGSYGRYSVGPRVGGLSSQFKDVEKYEEQQRRRFRRGREPGYTGAGFWFALYPNMTGTLASGVDVRQNVPNEQSESGRTAPVTDATGGTTFNGAAGVS